jgi:hypothetical protein
MKTGRIALILLAATVSAAPCSTVRAADHIQLAQTDLSVRMGPPRSPDVVIEEPRPPQAVIETEGRGEHQGEPRNCRSVNLMEWRDGVQVSRTERECDEP